MALLDPIYALPTPQKVILGVLPLVAVGALGWFLLISPKTDERDGLFQRNEALRAEVMKARADEANLRPFRLQAEALRKRLAAAKERLPGEKDIPRLYRQGYEPVLPARGRGGPFPAQRPRPRGRRPVARPRRVGEPARDRPWRAAAGGPDARARGLRRRSAIDTA